MDFAAILKAVGRATLIWCATLIVPIVAGFEGAVCMTPLAWVLGIVAGQTCIHVSRNQESLLGIAEAGVAGSLLGLIEGLIFIAVTRWLMGTSTSEENVAGLWIVMLISGMIICAILAAAIAAIVQARRRKNS